MKTMFGYDDAQVLSDLWDSFALRLGFDVNQKSGRLLEKFISDYDLSREISVRTSGAGTDYGDLMIVVPISANKFFRYCIKTPESVDVKVKKYGVFTTSYSYLCEILRFEYGVVLSVPLSRNIIASTKGVQNLLDEVDFDSEIVYEEMSVFLAKDVKSPLKFEGLFIGESSKGFFDWINVLDTAANLRGHNMQTDSLILPANQMKNPKVKKILLKRIIEQMGFQS